MSKTKKALIEDALNSAEKRGIRINPGAAAFWITNGNPYACSAFGALILHLNLRDFDKDPGSNRIAKPGWLKEVCKYLGVNGWWLRRFYCGFELGRIIFVKTSKKTSVFVFDDKDKKHYFTEDSVSKMGMKMSKKYG